MPYRIFLSHAIADKPLAQSLYDYCHGLGSLQVYMCEHDVQPGRPLSEKIEENMRASDAVLILLTPNSMNSTYVQQEIGLAKGAGKLLIPLLQKHTDTSRLGILESKEWIPFDPEDQEHGFNDVNKFFQKLSQKQATQERGGMQLQSVAEITLITLLLGLVFFMFYTAATSKQK